MTTKTHKSWEIQAQADQVHVLVEKERKAFEFARHDWMEDNNYCTACDAKGCKAYRPTLDYINDFYVSHCEKCGGTGKTDGTGTKCQAVNGAHQYGSVISSELVAPAHEEVRVKFPYHKELRELCDQWSSLLQEAKQARDAEKDPKGHRVVVARGRKVKKGTEGLCFWCGESQYGKRVGIKTDSGEKVFTALENVDLV
jgi:hypothetical protein